MRKKKQGKGFQWALTLFDSAQFFFEVNIKRGGSHLLLLSLGVSGGSRWAKTTNQGDFVVLKILEPRVKSLSWGTEMRPMSWIWKRRIDTNLRGFGTTHFHQRARSWVWRYQRHRQDAGNRQSSRQGCYGRWGPWTGENSCSRLRRSAWVIRLDSAGEEKTFEDEKARLLEEV